MQKKGKNQRQLQRVWPEQLEKAKFLLTAKRLTEKRRDMGSKNLVLNRLGLSLGCRVGRWIMNLELWERKKY